MSNELRTSTKDNTISSREVAVMMDYNHKDILRKIDNLNKELGVAQISSTQYWIESTYVHEQNKMTYREYQVTKKGCELIAHKTEGQKGVLFTVRYMDKFEEMEKKLQKQLPGTYIEALEQLLASEKEKARVQLELKDEQHKNEMLMHFNKLYTTTEIAKELGIKSAAKLNKVLNDKGIQFKQNGTWVLYSDYSECGYVSIKQTLLENGHIIYDRKWTQEGRKFLLDLLG